VVAELKQRLGNDSIVFTTAAKGDSEPTGDLASSRRVSIEIP
jgi:hypothetical protein